jgi:hypothetical protein
MDHRHSIVVLNNPLAMSSKTKSSERSAAELLKRPRPQASSSSAATAPLKPSAPAKRAKHKQKPEQKKEMGALERCSCGFDVLWSFLKGKHADLERMCFEEIMGFVHAAPGRSDKLNFTEHLSCGGCEVVVYRRGVYQRQGDYWKLYCECDVPSTDVATQAKKGGDRRTLEPFLLCYACLDDRNTDFGKYSSLCDHCGYNFCTKCLPLQYVNHGPYLDLSTICVLCVPRASSFVYTDNHRQVQVVNPLAARKQ